MIIPSRQEMFDRAVRGLAKQGWRRAISHEGDLLTCVYSTIQDGQELRCAWGHVDTTLTSAATGSVYSLNKFGLGIAARLAPEDLDFTAALQRAHDGVGDEPGELHASMFRFGAMLNLIWPADIALTETP